MQPPARRLLVTSWRQNCIAHRILDRVGVRKVSIVWDKYYDSGYNRCRLHEVALDDCWNIHVQRPDCPSCGFLESGQAPNTMMLYPPSCATHVLVSSDPY